MTKPVVLCILDGWGLSDTPQASAPAQARTPTMDRLMAGCPHATLITHGPDVGLPKGQMGNSEVGHMNIGAGRVVSMDLGRIDLEIEQGRFARQPALQRWIETLKESGGRAHVMGVVSDGGVHGHIAHMLAACQTIHSAGVPVYAHAITDGRDVAPRSAPRFVGDLAKGLPRGVRIATVTGRYWAMDRDMRWERTQRAFDAMVHAIGNHAPTALDAVAQGAADGIYDEFLNPAVIGDFTGMAPGDGVFCLNFRADRARQILDALAAPGFDRFKAHPPPLHMLGMVTYSDAHDSLMRTLYPKQRIKNTLAAWVARHGLRQLHLAETEKYPHVTFFLNGGKETPENGEDREMPRSPPVATYDLAPEMNASAVTDCLVAGIARRYDLIVVNYANPDMVGHTGNLAAAIRACEAVDTGLTRAVAALEKAGGTMLVCADHGNCETMVHPETGAPHTAHTLNPVPVILWGGPKGARLHNGRLADLAPTVLHLMGLTPPPDMTGRNLVA